MDLQVLSGIGVATFVLEVVLLVVTLVLARGRRRMFGGIGFGLVILSGFAPALLILITEGQRAVAVSLLLSVVPRVIFMAGCVFLALAVIAKPADAQRFGNLPGFGNAPGWNPPGPPPPGPYQPWGQGGQPSPPQPARNPYDQSGYTG